jgi:hypothetical protein
MRPRVSDFTSTSSPASTYRELTSPPSVRAAAPAMIDPGWTPARGYSHAAEIMRLLDEAKREPVSVLLDRKASGGGTVRELTDAIGRGTVTA